jgi:hypothetical protein
MCGPRQRCRVDHKRLQPPLVVDHIQVGVIVRDDAADVGRDGGAQLAEVAFRDHRVRDVEQRTPVVGLHPKAWWRSVLSPARPGAFISSPLKFGPRWICAAQPDSCQAHTVVRRWRNRSCPPHERALKPESKEQIMSMQATVTVKAARKVVDDEVESQIHTFEAQVATLKAKAESAKADAQLAAIANLATAKRVLDAKVAELKSAGEAKFEEVKAEVERRAAEFERALEAIASKING